MTDDRDEVAPTVTDPDALRSGRDPDDEAALPAAPPPPGEYSANAGSYYRNVRYVLALALIAAGGWFLYDGFKKYPAERERYGQLTEEAAAANERGDNVRAGELLKQRSDEGVQDHNDTDILLQRVLGMVLPPLGLALLIRWLYISRGRVRLDSSDTLHYPGHPPVPASAITELDDDLWDRKGIAHVSYSLPGGVAGRIKLDDFVYERKGIDDIHDRLKHVVGSRVPGA